MQQLGITPKERAELANMAGCSEQFLYQCLTGRKSMDAKEAVRVERATGCRLRRWQLRTKDWHETWPELIGAEGAPPVPAESPAGEAANAQ